MPPLGGPRPCRRRFPLSPKIVRSLVAVGVGTAAALGAALPAWALTVTVDGQAVAFNPSADRARRPRVRSTPRRLRAARRERRVRERDDQRHRKRAQHPAPHRLEPGDRERQRPDARSSPVRDRREHLRAAPLRFGGARCGCELRRRKPRSWRSIRPPVAARRRAHHRPSLGICCAICSRAAKRRSGRASRRSRRISRKPVDPNSLQLTLDGLDISRDATRSDTGFIYSPPSPLQSRPHTVMVSGNLASGQPFQESWHFSTGASSNRNTLSILAPVDGSGVGRTFVVRGRSVPYALVHVDAGASASFVGRSFAFGTGKCERRYHGRWERQLLGSGERARVSGRDDRRDDHVDRSAVARERPKETSTLVVAIGSHERA